MTPCLALNKETVYGRLAYRGLISYIRLNDPGADRKPEEPPSVSHGMVRWRWERGEEDERRTRG